MNTSRHWPAAADKPRRRKRRGERPPKVERIGGAAAQGAVGGAAAPSLNAVRAARSGATRVRAVADQWRNTSPERLAGRLAEELHATTFNIDAARKGLNSLKAATGAANGTGTAAADVLVTNAGRVVDHAQVKSHGSAAKTTYHVADRRYDGMQRVVPSDQVQKVRKVAAKRGVDALGKRNYPDVAQNASDRLRSRGAESEPLSRKEALSAARDPGRVTGELIRREVAQAVKKGAVAGAAVGGTVSAVTNAMAYAKGEKSGTNAITDTLKDTASCGVSGAAASGAALFAESVLVRAGARRLARSAAPVAIGLTVVDVGKEVGRFVKGDINGSSAESVGPLRLGKAAHGVVEGRFGRFEGPEAVCPSGGQFQFVVQALHGAG